MVVVRESWGRGVYLRTSRGSSSSCSSAASATLRPCFGDNVAVPATGLRMPDVPGLPVKLGHQRFLLDRSFRRRSRIGCAEHPRWESRMRLALLCRACLRSIHGGIPLWSWV